MRLIPVTILALCLAANAMAAEYKDIRYADVSERNLLDIYVPDGVENPPLLLAIHGGAFRVGDKSEVNMIAELMDAGFAVASMNYRFSLDAKYPAQIDDVSAAIVFLRENSEQYGYSAEKMGSIGFSAGGYLSSMAGIALAGEESTRVQASVDGFGPILFHEMDADMAAIGKTPKMGPTSSADSPEAELLGVDLSENTDAALAASPISFIEGNAEFIPPFLIVHGLEDDLISYKQSERLYDALLQNGIDAKIVLVEGAGHGKGVFEEEQILETIAFFEAHLK